MSQEHYTSRKAKKKMPASGGRRNNLKAIEKGDHLDAGLQYMGLLQKVSGKLRTTCQTVCMNRLGLSIEERSLEINERLRFNDLGDSAVGKDGKSSVRTLVECKAARPFALKANVRIVADMLETLMKLNERPFPFVFYFTIILNSPHLWKWSNRGHYDVIVPCLM